MSNSFKMGMLTFFKSPKNLDLQQSRDHNLVSKVLERNDVHVVIFLFCEYERLLSIDSRFEQSY